MAHESAGHELHGNYGPEARRAVAAEAALPTTGWEREVARGLEMGLQGADSIVDRTIPTFSRGELPRRAPRTEVHHQGGRMTGRVDR